MNATTGMSPAQAVSYLRTRRPLERPGARLLCLPYAGGGTTIFHTWAAGLPAGVEVRAAQFPGRQDRIGEPAFKSVPPILDRLLAALHALPPAPLVIYGHSFGALLGYELAQKLRGTPLSPRALVVGARRAPQLPSRVGDLHQLPDHAFKQELHRRYGTPLAVLQDDCIMSLAMPALRADLTALETHPYIPQAPLDIPLFVLWASQDASMSAEEASAWRACSTRSTTIHEVDAGHLFVDTNRAWVLARVSEVLSSLTL